MNHRFRSNTVTQGIALNKQFTRLFEKIETSFQLTSLRFLGRTVNRSRGCRNETCVQKFLERTHSFSGQKRQCGLYLFEAPLRICFVPSDLMREKRVVDLTK